MVWLGNPPPRASGASIGQHARLIYGQVDYTIDRPSPPSSAKAFAFSSTYIVKCDDFTYFSFADSSRRLLTPSLRYAAASCLMTVPDEQRRRLAMAEFERPSRARSMTARSALVSVLTSGGSCAGPTGTLIKSRRLLMRVTRAPAGGRARMRGMPTKRENTAVAGGRQARKRALPDFG